MLGYGDRMPPLTIILPADVGWTGRAADRDEQHMGERRRHGDTVHITSARTSHSEDLRARQNRYLFSMAVRTVCVVLAVVTAGYLRWAFIAGAVFLPYIAVVMANAGAKTDPEGPEPFIEGGRLMLPPGESGPGETSPGEKDRE